MRTKILASLFGGFLVALLLFPDTASSIPRELQLQDVDRISIHAWVNNKGVLWIDVHYESQKVSVFWSEGSVNCTCQVYEYEDEGTAGGGNRGSRITGMSKIFMTVQEKISVDIPERYLDKFKRGIVECSFDTGFGEFKAQNIFELRFGN
jgi:hypothetical protein